MKQKIIAFFIVAVLLGLTDIAGTIGNAQEKPTVYLGVGPRYHPITMYERFQPMMDYLTQQTPYRFELKIMRDYPEVIVSLAEGKIAVSAVGDGGLMRAMLVHGAIPIVRPLNSEGKPVYRCNFVVRANSGIRSLSELKGKKIALGSRHSTTGNLIPRAMLITSGVMLEDLGLLGNLSNHDAVARAVAKGEYDAGAVKSTIAEIYKSKGLRVLAESAELPSIALIAGKDVPRELIQSMSSALLRLDRRNPEHRRLLESWDYEYRYGFAPATAADYNELLGIFKTVPYGCATGCHQ